MNKESSIQTSILLTVTASLALLAVVLISIQSRHEYYRMIETTNELVKEQISLTVNQLDTYRVLDQVPFIAKTVYQLERVKGLNIFDENCSLLSKRPMNFKPRWDCNEENIPSGLMLYKSENSVSMSGGAPRYILVKVKYNDKAFLSWNNLWTALIIVLLVLATISALVFLMRKKILRPIGMLNEIIGRSGSLKRDSDDFESLPKELKPIYEKVLLRDDVIQQSRESLLQRKEDEVTAKVSRQVAHDIRFPIMVLRDKLLHSKDSSEDIYRSSLNDLEQLTGQILENTSDYVKEIDLVGAMSDVVNKKQVEYRNFAKNVNLELLPFAEAIKVSLNPTRFKFIISNLINNAKESVPMGKPCHIRVSVDVDNKKTIVKIRDNGIGIKEKDIEKIFDRGVSLNKPGGNGLGLSDAKEFIENAKGSIEIKSNHKKGTEVTIMLPTVSAGFQSVGTEPFDNVLIEDYKLSQLLWLDEAKEKDLNLVVFSSPQEFLRNKSVVKESANIYLDSHFPDFAQKGEDWAKDLYATGYQNIWMCSTIDVETKEMDWIQGKVSKNRPFEKSI